MDPILSHLFEISPLVAVLGLAVWYFHRRDTRNETRAEERHKTCEERNRKLDDRVQSLETRQFEQLHDLAERGIAGLVDSTAAIKRFMRDETVTPPNEMPTIRHPTRYRTPRPGG